PLPICIALQFGIDQLNRFGRELSRVAVETSMQKTLGQEAETTSVIKGHAFQPASAFEKINNSRSHHESEVLALQMCLGIPIRPQSLNVLGRPIARSFAGNHVYRL